MAKVFTPSTLAEIVRRATQGDSASTIAQVLGLNVGSLRVKCSQLGISFRECRASQSKNRAPGSAAGHAKGATSAAREAKPKAHMARHFLKDGPDSIPIIVKIPRLTFVQLRQLGKARGVSAEILAAELLAVIGNDNLCEAVLDHDLT